MGGSFEEPEKTEALTQSSRTSGNLLSARCRDGGKIRQDPVPQMLSRVSAERCCLTAYQQGLQENKNQRAIVLF